ARRRLRVPMFAKFLIGCLSLAAMLIIGGTYVVKKETQLRSRGNYLQKSARRLAGYVERVGQGMTGTLEILAGDPELRGPLAPIQEEPVPPPRPPAKGGATPAPANPAAGAARAAEGGVARSEPRAQRVEAVGRRMLEQLSAKNGLNPDLFGIFTPSNELLFTI